MSVFGASVLSHPAQITLSVNKQQMGSYLKVKFFIVSAQCIPDTQESEIFNIDNLATVRFIFRSNTTSRLSSYVLINKHDNAIGSTVKVKMTCQALRLSKEWIYADDVIDNCEREIGELKSTSSCGNVDQFLLEAIICVSKIESLFAKLYEDNDFTDFYLSTDKGQRIPVHRACLAVHSEVFKAILIGKGTETSSGDIKVKGVTFETLKHFKQYMYLGTLPEYGLGSLLVIATAYSIENLKKQCVIKLAAQVTTQNLCNILKFAFEKKIPELTFAILLTLPEGVVSDAAKKNRKKRRTRRRKVIEKVAKDLFDNSDSTLRLSSSRTN